MEGTFSTCTKVFGRYKTSLHVHTTSSEHLRLSDHPQEQSCLSQAWFRQELIKSHALHMYTDSEVSLGHEHKNTNTHVK